MPNNAQVRTNLNNIYQGNFQNNTGSRARANSGRSFTNNVTDFSRRRTSGKPQSPKGGANPFNRASTRAAQQAKPPSANNLGKFGRGLQSRFAQALQGLGKLRTAAGARLGQLGSALSSSKFFAGINSVPGLALIAGNIVVWDSNIRQIRNLYEQGNPQPLDFPIGERIETPEFLPEYRPIDDYQNATPGVRYGLRYGQASFSNGEFVSYGLFSSPLLSRTAPLPKITWEVNGIEIEGNEHWSIGGEGLAPIIHSSTNFHYTFFANGEIFTNTLRGRGHILYGWQRLDGESDIENRADYIPGSVSFNGITNDLLPTNNAEDIEQLNPTPIKPANLNNSSSRGLNEAVSNLGQPIPQVNPQLLPVPLPISQPLIRTPQETDFNPSQNKPQPARKARLTQHFLPPGATTIRNGSASGFENRRIVTQPIPTTRTDPCMRGCPTGGGFDIGNIADAVGLVGDIADLIQQNQLEEDIAALTQLVNLVQNSQLALFQLLIKNQSEIGNGLQTQGVLPDNLYQFMPNNINLSGLFSPEDPETIIFQRLEGIRLQLAQARLTEEVQELNSNQSPQITLTDLAENVEVE